MDRREVGFERSALRDYSAASSATIISTNAGLPSARTGRKFPPSQGVVAVNLGVVGQSIERVVFDFGVTLISDDGAEIRIETAFTLRTLEGAIVVIDPAELGESAAVLPAVLHEMITRATADEVTGSLELEFVHGSRVEVLPSDAYEAWSFTAQDGSRAVALPGGGLSTWSAHH